MLIRRAIDADAPAIARFIAMAESEMLYLFAGTDDKDKALEFVLGFVRNPVVNRYSLAANLVAEIDGRPAGSIICFPADRQPDLDGPLLTALNRRGFNLDKLSFEGEPGAFYLSTMGVNPDFRGLGVGSALMAAAEAEGAKQGFSRISLLVSKDKPRAMALYERKGYATIREIRIADSEYFRMAKDL